MAKFVKSLFASITGGKEEFTDELTAAVSKSTSQTKDVNNNLKLFMMGESQEPYMMHLFYHFAWTCKCGHVFSKNKSENSTAPTKCNEQEIEAFFHTLFQKALVKVTLNVMKEIIHVFKQSLDHTTKPISTMLELNKCETIDDLETLVWNALSAEAPHYYATLYHCFIVPFWTGFSKQVFEQELKTVVLQKYGSNVWNYVIKRLELYAPVSVPPNAQQQQQQHLQTSNDSTIESQHSTAYTRLVTPITIQEMMYIPIEQYFASTFKYIDIDIREEMKKLGNLNHHNYVDNDKIPNNNNKQKKQVQQENNTQLILTIRPSM